MIVLIDGIRYQLTTPKSEAVLENAIQSNCQHIFGPDSFYFDIKRKIKSKAGVASIPDGYVIFFTPKKARWAIIEVELASHPVYDHVIPQLGKFNKGIKDSSTRKKLVEILYGVFDDNEVLKARLKQKIKTGEIYKFISDLVSEKPLIIVVIDKRTEELEEAVSDIRGDVKVVEFKTFRREGVSDDVNAFVFEPVFSEPADNGNGNGSKERDTDKFGSRLSSNQAKINAVLSNKPKTMKTLMEEAGLSSTYYNHLKSLIDKGFVEKTDKGFREIVDGPKKEKYSEFWAPIRKEGLFKGKPVPIRDEGWIAKNIKGINISLYLRNHKCSIPLSLKGPDRKDRRDKVAKLFPKSKYEYEVRESSKFAIIEFPVLDKGMKDRKDWPEIRKELTKLGTDIYNKIRESGI